MMKAMLALALIAAAQSTWAQALHEPMHHDRNPSAENSVVAARPQVQHADKKMQAGMNMDMQAGSMCGMYGPYRMTREASGTSWQPDNTSMEGVDGMQGPWMTMWHGYVNAVYDHQGGPCGDKKTFAESMPMLMAQRPLAGGTLGLRAMTSLDPTIGKGGYPLLFQTGETADGAPAWSTASIRMIC